MRGWNAARQKRHDGQACLPTPVADYSVDASVIKSYYSFVARRARPLSMPVHYHLEATSVCNLRCSFCPYSTGDIPRGGWGFLRTDLCDKILQQIEKWPPALGVSLHLGGEPLLHPEFDSLVRLVNDRLHKRPVVATNATRLTSTVVERVVRAGGACFEIDFAARRDVFERLRDGADWDLTRGNIAAAIAAGLTVFLFALDGDTVGLRGLFGNHPNLAIEDFRIHNWGGSFAHVMERRFNLQRHGASPRPCTHPWFGMAIAWNGAVVICCRDVLHKHVIGDATRQDLQEIWSGAAFQRIRVLQARGSLDSLPLCQTCDRPYDPVNAPLRVLLSCSPLSKILYQPRRYRRFSTAHAAERSDYDTSKTG
jgi:hypothetical protein